MGLDIYLVSREHQAAENAHEKAYNEAYARFYDEDGTLREGCTEEQWDEARRALPPYPTSPDEKTPSTAYPEHYCNRRYLRSSYNEGGFNRAVPDMTGTNHDLYWIFDPVIGDDNDEYEWVLNDELISALEQCKERALQVAGELRDCDGLRTTTVNSMLGSAEHMWHELPTEEQALAWYREEKDKVDQRPAQWLAKHPGEELPDWVTEDHGYSNAKGEIYGFESGLEVLGAVLGANPLAKFSAALGTNTMGHQLGALPIPILIYRLNKETEGFKYYVEEAEIAAELCDEAIALIKADGKCYLHWSG